MAFNFNWTPLSTTSSEFYTRAKDLLTTALNKAPKPPIIVDDIIVEGLNLGSTAPELEILEIGDLAEDRFRGIFKISYDGDAELTLKTKVQANPLSTYLSTTPSFTSPRPLAASAPLTIPLQITLSQFRLSGFVILVFSKAKGVTLVFRNDPLESLRVSSTFDSIPFIKDYLQKEIERVVRGLFQEELPVGIHRLSLKWFNPDYAASLEAENANIGSGTHQVAHSNNGDSEDEGDANSRYVNPLAASSDESLQQQFSTKNLEDFEKLARSQKTFSVGGPGIEDVVYRAWAAPSVVPTWSNGGVGWTEPPGTPAGEKAAPTTYTFDDRGEAVLAGINSRPGLVSTASSMSVNGSGTASSVNGARLNGRGRKKKHRVVNLRRKTQPETAESVSGASESTMDLGSMSPATSVYGEDYSREGSVVMEDEQEASETQQHPYILSRGGSMRRTNSNMVAGSEMPSPASSTTSSRPQHVRETRRMAPPPPLNSSTTSSHTQLRPSVPSTPATATAPIRHIHEAQDCGCPHIHQYPQAIPIPPNPWLTLATMVGAAGNGGNGSGVLEQAVLMKLAGEVARLQAKERESKSGGRRQEEDEDLSEVEAPPAYGA